MSQAVELIIRLSARQRGEDEERAVQAYRWREIHRQQRLRARYGFHSYDVMGDHHAR